MKSTKPFDLAERRRSILQQLDKLAPLLVTKGDRSGFTAQMRYLEGQLDILNELLLAEDEKCA